MEGRYALYLDTSALVKLYVEEDHSGLVDVAAEGASDVYVSAIAELEALATFARLRHEGRLDDEGFARVTAKLEEDLEDGYVVVPYGRELAARAGELALKHEGLRAYDALHLATALSAAEDEAAGGGVPVRMMCFDARLLRAVRAEKFALYWPSRDAPPGDGGTGDVAEEREET